MNKSIHIIYYIWINPNRNWKIIVKGQLEDIIESNILQDAHLNIVLCTSCDELLTEATYFIIQTINYADYLTFNLTCTLKNNFEYEGIKKLYDMANQEPDKLYIYMHSKGMFNKEYDSNNRLIDEIILTKTLFNNWKNIKNIFNNNKYIVKAGLVPALGGWIWFNFFWTTGHYIRTCEIPKISDVRYYYESWLTTSILTEFNCYSLYSNDIRRYSQEEAVQIIDYYKSQILK
jgi:hypothetical protein